MYIKRVLTFACVPIISNHDRIPYHRTAFSNIKDSCGDDRFTFAKIGEPFCKKGHVLIHIEAPIHMYQLYFGQDYTLTCKVCKINIKKGNSHYSCDWCRFDMCHECFLLRRETLIEEAEERGECPGAESPYFHN